MRSPLLTPANAFDLSAIMRRAWGYARAGLKSAALAKLATTFQAEFRTALRRVWDEARSARSYAVWAAEQDAAAEARKVLDARTREIEALRFERAAAEGIDSTSRFLATARAIDVRLAALGSLRCAAPQIDERGCWPSSPRGQPPGPNTAAASATALWTRPGSPQSRSRRSPAAS